MVKVFGHIAPDTDTTCSAIIWAWYLNTHTSMDATPYILGEINSETRFVLNKWSLPVPESLENVSLDDEVVIVDTNNPQELPDTINESKITQIIDHHKLVGGLTTENPIEITIRPLASTASVLYGLMGKHTEELPDNIAGLMLSCILSDTLEFRSPTTTPHDKDIAEKLAKQLDLDIPKYATEMFEAKSDISDFTDIGLVRLDSKKFDVGGKNLRVSVVETTNPTSVLDRKDGLVNAIQETIKEEHDVDEVLFFIVDILKEESTVFTHSALAKQIIETSFNVTVEGDTEVLPGIVSRKKQILPALKI